MTKEELKIGRGVINVIKMVIPKCIKNNNVCKLHSNNKYLHWKCGEYNPIERRKIYLSKFNICKICKNKCSQFNTRCKKCYGRILGEKRKGKKLPQWWKDKISIGQMGEKHWNFKGYITKTNKLIRENKKFRKWREKIFKRDNYTCQECFIRGGNLHPHHIKKLSLLIEENNIKTIKDAIECKKIWDISNGITLCDKCHSKKHKVFMITRRKTNKME